MWWQGCSQERSSTYSTSASPSWPAPRAQPSTQLWSSVPLSLRSTMVSVQAALGPLLLPFAPPLQRCALAAAVCLAARKRASCFCLGTPLGFCPLTCLARGRPCQGMWPYAKACGRLSSMCHMRRRTHAWASQVGLLHVFLHVSYAEEDTCMRPSILVVASSLCLSPANNGIWAIPPASIPGELGLTARFGAGGVAHIQFLADAPCPVA